ncbi:MAG: ECF transporter S component [Ruminococcaceae bacterium]|nr:ECF transporter S component [Oscillospiraceae bacterium]
MKNDNLKKLIITAAFSAIAFLITFVFKFKVMFLTFDFKDAVISIVSLVLGPLYGLTSVGIVTFLEFLSISDTGPYGLIMNFISSASFAVIIGSIYKYKRTFSGAILATVVSSLGVTTVMMVANYFITPFYMGVSASEVAAMIPTVLLPFNLAKTVMNSATTLIIYKPVVNTLRRVKLVKNNENYSGFTKKTIALYLVSIIIMIITIMFIVFVLKGGFEIIA